MKINELPLGEQIRVLGFDEGCEPELTFHPHRRWRFDFAWPARAVALELDGGTWAQGRHTRGKGYQNDCEKFNEATLLGWRVYRVTTQQVKNGYAANLLQRILTDEQTRSNRKTEGS